MFDPKYKELFNALSRSQLGRELAEYCELVMDEVCNSRNWGDKDTKESANQAAETIKKYFKNRLGTVTEPKPHTFEHE